MDRGPREADGGGGTTPVAIVDATLRSTPSRPIELVADQLRAHLPSTDVLTEAQRVGSPDRAVSHTLHVEHDGSFSITAVVWRPGQFTRIHDHTTWCVFGVIQGVEHEEVYDPDLNLIGSSDGMLVLRLMDPMLRPLDGPATN